MLKTFLSSLIVLIGFSSNYLTQNNPRSNNEGLEKKIKTPNNKTLSAGINIFSFIKPSLFYSRSPDSFFSSNLTVNVFLQKELTNCFALRIPVRVGLELPNRIISMGQNDFFYQARKTVIGDIGLEPIYFIKSGDKYTWTIVPSFSIGKGVKMIEEQLGQSYGETYRYIKVGEYTYFKGGCSTGAHRVMYKTFQIGIELGLYFANNDWDDYFERNYYLGREVKCLISYQFLKPII